MPVAQPEEVVMVVQVVRRQFLAYKQYMPLKRVWKEFLVQLRRHVHAQRTYSAAIMLHISKFLINIADRKQF